MTIHSIDRRARRTARNLARHHVDPETGEIMSLRIKQTGQRHSGVTPVDGTGEHHASQIRKALADDGAVVYTLPRSDGTEHTVRVTTRKHRRVAVPTPV